MSLQLPAATSGLEKACGDEPSWLCEEVYSLSSNGTVAKITDFLINKPLKVLIVFVVAFIVYKLGKRLIKRGLRRLTSDNMQSKFQAMRDRTPDVLLETQKIDIRSGQRAEALVTVLSSIYGAIVWLIAILVSVDQIGVDLGPLLAGAGIIGIAVGIGAQSLIKDFVAGFFVLVEDQFGIGDHVNLDDTEGKVEAISMRTTRIRAIDGTVWHIPNGEVRRIGNRSQLWSRALLDIEVSYKDDLETVKKLIKEVADQIWKEDARVIAEPEVWGVETLGSSGVSIRLIAKTLPAKQWEVQRVLRERIKLRFDKEGIEIPFPQQDLWIRTGSEGS